MDELLGILLIVWMFAATVGTVDNMLFQTPDSRIISQCKEQGYLNVKQITISCSIEKEVKK